MAVPPPPDSTSPEALREALKRTAVALKGSGVPFALAGGYAAWARGGPEPDHDVDFIVRQEDSERAAESLRGQGLRVEQPPEDWLFKVFSDGAMVDVIHRPAAGRGPDGALERAEELEVLSVVMPVLAAGDVLLSKLSALSEHYCDFAVLLPVARALREQVDWPLVADRVGDNPFALSFLDLLGRLGVLHGGGTGEPPTLEA